MAHDEGIYATQARAILQTGDWITPQWGGGYSFDRTIGIQWLIASSYLGFGISEGTARLPSAIAFILSVLLTYAIGKRLTTPRMAWLGAAIFSIIPLVAQYARLGTQDMVLVCIELIAIWTLLLAETSGRPWRFVAGAMFGWGFMIKGFMIIPAAIALFPYLIAQHRRHRHLLDPWLYLGFGIGLMPVIFWLGAAIQKYGTAPIQELFGKLFHLGGQTYQGANQFYYFWNIPANGFPWVFFALGGLWLAFRHPDIRALIKSHQTRFLLIGYPVTLFIELTLFGTKTHYYPLQLMPFVGLFAAIALSHLVHLYTEKKYTGAFIGLNLLMGAIAIFLLVVVNKRTTIAQLLQSSSLRSSELDKIALVVLAVGLGWLSLPLIWILRDRMAHSAKYWAASWLVTSWFAIAALHLTGLWGDYDPQLKQFLLQANVQEVLRSQPVSFIVDEKALSRDDRKTQLLLNFYTPKIGQEIENPKILPNTDYAWIDPNLAKTPGLKYEIVDVFEGWNLAKRWQQTK
ncbi:MULTISPECIES: ArnT family glycosyltransferase [Leptolyngbya]|jgi:4-amino-4-deoxy-L-arabinose transferase-like glycosyltransferase|nr:MULTISPECIES: glycosyltransferase family 39 protein [Leptolyngbya]MBD2366696.1 glycosyltransferase family 39 protein [Leptolyngbya sp. FACHB-161]MBD2373290.1 glycosyltransferase family 39 protein [Leptolyngbya sp. FACHB-238]MBD2397690.1 glycosyltransferase family 39 protein [Leptolyngbya sp. FACHB-239]MBD2404834.1 glycosyltransferase family 39 protein [Leptolyngbya sp. FACHB-402]ULP30411.1 glycosyltransferase family 39 protein [Leptolyngbya boryana IU 594]